MSIKDRSSSRFQNGGNSEDYEIRNSNIDQFYAKHHFLLNCTAMTWGSANYPKKIIC